MATFDRRNLRNKAELIIGISNWCNYDCSYCMPHSKARTSRNDGSEELINIIHDSYRHFKQNADVENYGVMFVGGEPTIHAGFEKIITDIQEIREIEPNYRIVIVTNMSRTHKWWTRIAPKVTGLVASYHDEFTDPSAFADKVSHCMLTNPDLYVTIGIQPLPGKLDILNDHTRELRDRITQSIGVEHANRQLDFIIQHLYISNDNLYPYTDVEFEKFTQMMQEFSNPMIKESERLSSQEEFITHSFSEDDEYMGSNCYAGVESLTVGFNGTVKRTARCGLSGEKNDLGNIYTGYTLPTAPAVCDVKKGCGNCWFDYAVRKKS